MDPTSNQTLQFLTEFYPQILDSVPQQVLRFGLPNPVISWIFALFTGILLVISITGNSLMIYLYSRYKTLRSPANKLVINLALANMLMHSKSWILIVNGLDGGPLLGSLGKQNHFLPILLFIRSGASEASVATITQLISCSKCQNWTLYSIEYLTIFSNFSNF